MPVRIVFVHACLLSFVEKDLDILCFGHRVRDLHFRELQDICALVCGTKRTDLTFFWFGKLHAFFAVTFSGVLGENAVVVGRCDVCLKSRREVAT